MILAGLCLLRRIVRHVGAARQGRPQHRRLQQAVVIHLQRPTARCSQQSAAFQEPRGKDVQAALSRDAGIVAMEVGPRMTRRLLMQQHVRQPLKAACFTF